MQPIWNTITSIFSKSYPSTPTTRSATDTEVPDLAKVEALEALEEARERLMKTHIQDLTNTGNPTVDHIRYLPPAETADIVFQRDPDRMEKIRERLDTYY